MIKIDTWAFIRTEIYFDEQQKQYKTRICSMTKDDFRSKLKRVTGIIGAGSKNEEFFISNNGIDIYSEDNKSVKTLNGEVFMLGTINPYYATFLNAINMEMPIMSKVSLPRGISGEYQMKGNLYDKQIQSIVSKKIIGQDVEKSLLYFDDNSFSFVDWVNAKFDDKIKLDIIKKKIGFEEYVGLSIMPMFKF